MTTDSRMASGQARSLARKQILAIALLFALPIVLAWVVFSRGWLPHSTTNHGVLIQPPLALTPSGWTTRQGKPFQRTDLLGFWNLLLVVDGACQKPCVDTLDLLRRLRIALGADLGRVHLLLLQPQGSPAPSLPEVSMPVVSELLAPGERVAGLLAKSVDGGASGKGVFIVDYRAYNMMTYSFPLDGSGMLKDVKHLLKLSDPQFERNQQPAQDSKR